MITAGIVEAFLKCPTKCYLRSLGEVGIENAYANWARAQNESYRNDGIKRLTEGAAPDECIFQRADECVPTQQAASGQVLNLLADNNATRLAAWNTISRASHDPIGLVAFEGGGGPLPNDLTVWSYHLKDLAEVSNTMNALMDSMLAWASPMYFKFFNKLVCVSCKQYVARTGVQAAAQLGWSQCSHCGKISCRTCRPQVCCQQAEMRGPRTTLKGVTITQLL